ncbi:hypothetical protein V8C86DRAFT_2520228 [Haematococcus lacustris]
MLCVHPAHLLLAVFGGSLQAGAAMAASLLPACTLNSLGEAAAVLLLCHPPNCCACSLPPSHHQLQSDLQPIALLSKCDCSYGGVR